MNIKIMYKALVGFACISLIIFTTYANLVLKGQITNVERDLLIQSRNLAFKDGIEGRWINDVWLSNISGRRTKFFDICRQEKYSLIIMEPSSACNSCLNIALHDWIIYKDSTQGRTIPKLYIICSSEWKKSYITARQYKLEESCFIDSSGSFYKRFGIPSAVSIALFVDENGRVIYAQFINWKDPELFVNLSHKVLRFLNRSAWQN